MAGRDTITLKVDVDAKAAARGLQPLNKALKETSDVADKTEKDLNKLGSESKIDLKVDDDAIASARHEITRLREQIREDLKLDINADTKTPLRRINELQRVVKKLDEDTVNVDVNVDVDKSELSRLQSGIEGIGSAAKKVPGILKAVGALAGAATLGLGTVGIGVGGLVLETLKLADNMANAKIAFTQFLGSGKEANKFLKNLQDFAAHTPFEFPDLVESSKTLLAFGIKSKDIIPLMTSLGDAAALTGGQVGDLTTIWGQMQAKGKVANEELLQLTEHGIPAYKLLSDALGVPVSKIQKMAEKGELLSDKVLPILKGKLDETFGGGMAKQAETLSGLWSTMKDNLAAIGTSMGDAFTPVVSEQIGNLTGKLQEWGDWASEHKEDIATSFAVMAGTLLRFAADTTDAFQSIIFAGADLMDMFSQMEGLIKIIYPPSRLMFKNTNFEDAADNLRHIGGTLGDVSDGLRDSAKDAEKTGKQWAKTFRESDGLTKLDHQIRDTKAHIADLSKKPPTTEVRLKIAEARKKLSSLRAQRDAFNESKKQAKIKVDVKDARSKMRNIKQALHDLGQQKQTPQVKAEIKEWRRKYRQVKADIKALEKKQVKPRINPTLYKPQVTSTLGELQQIATPKGKGKGRVAPIRAKLDPTSRTYVAETLAQLVNPGGKGRSAKVKANVDEPSLNETNKKLNHAARDRTSTIRVVTIGPGGGGLPSLTPGPNAAPSGFVASGPDTRAGLVAAARALSASPTSTAVGPAGYLPGTQGTAAAPPGGTTAAPVHLAPKQTPVAVYLDGAEIATSLELRARQLASVGTVRRRTA